MTQTNNTELLTAGLDGTGTSCIFTVCWIFALSRTIKYAVGNSEFCCVVWFLLANASCGTTGLCVRVNRCVGTCIGSFVCGFAGCKLKIIFCQTVTDCQPPATATIYTL